MIRKFLASWALIAFVLWILPLGVFFKPFQEEAACNGQRAICLCSHLVAKAKAKMSGTVYKGMSEAQKEVFSASSASSHFLLLEKSERALKNFSYFHHQQSHLYYFFLVRPIEHVPLA